VFPELFQFASEIFYLSFVSQHCGRITSFLEQLRNDRGIEAIFRSDIAT
jgi:hypothetical protein